MAKTKKQNGMTLSALRSRLRQGDIAPVYVVAGSESFLADEAVRSITEAVRAQGGEYSRSFYHGDEADLASVLDDVRSLNLFGPRRLVLVSPADRFVQTHAAALGRYATAPAPNGHVVLVVTNADARKKLTKEVQKAGGLIACNRLYERDVMAWISARVKAMDRQIESAAVALLAEFLGTDLAAIAAELEKVVTYIEPRKRITPADVETISLRDRGREIYELTDAIGRREPAKLLAILNGLLERGEKAGRILFGVSSHMRRLWTVKDLIRKGQDPKAAANVVGVRYYVEQFLAQAGAFSTRDLTRNCSALLECEATLKSSGVDERILLETTFVRLLRRRQTTAAGAS